MLEIPTLRILRLQAQQDVEVEVNGALDSRLRQALAFALAGFGYLFLKSLVYLSRQFFPDTADESFALLWASVFGITPRAATAAVGPVLVKGAAGSVLAGGEILQRDDGAQFAVNDPAVVAATEEVEVTVTALDDWVGEVGNTEAGTTLTFVAPPAGIEPAANVVPGGLVDGFEAESIASVQARTLAKIRAQNLGGSEDDYENWALEVEGVGSAYARGSYAGIGTVLLIIAQEWDPTNPGDTPIPSLGLITSVEAYIGERKPAGLYLVAIQPPVLQPLDPFIVLEPDTPDIRDAVERSLALRLAEVEPDGTAYYDDLVNAVNRAAGEEHHQLWVSDGQGGFGPYNTVVGSNNLIIPGTISWTSPP